MKIPKTIKNALAVLLTTTLVVVFAGCATGGNNPTNDPASPTGDITNDFALQLIVKAGTSEILDGDKGDAVKVSRLCETAIKIAATGQVVTMPNLDDWLKEQIMKSDFEMSTKQALVIFKDNLALNFERRIDAGQLDPTKLEPVVTILAWIKEAADDTIKYGGARSYGVPPTTEVGSL